jgi:hemerythrin-like domain-containing protein
MNGGDSRRAFLTIAGAGALLAACRKEERAQPEPVSAVASAAASTTTNAAQPPRGDDKASKADKANKEGEEDVSAVEDLMREHGVIRRVLVVYRESAARLRTKPAALPPDALQKAAKLMRTFAEDYHEKQLEEANIFPAVSKGTSAFSATVNTLLAQHQRGREITDYILAVTLKAIGAQSAEPLAKTLEAFARMYEEHTAFEDTIVFPAWKKVLSPKDLDEMGDRFEDIEHKTFGKDGFDDAVDQVGAIEKVLGIDLGALTAPSPPKP